jgi:hypothetical protein
MYALLETFIEVFRYGKIIVNMWEEAVLMQVA